ncbi:unnamed protein product [Cyprideis torosa]|uniref:Uncharacterized protein n=1 Tax=Cyprideis torosa TaxID=163714 RepID=A0A7R8W8N6_9CRUS|nr:unnamed protein product [Cyprideis torosa]CAG0886421.1 unnamed protein product [Cyprideis torosa]
MNSGKIVCLSALNLLQGKQRDQIRIHSDRDSGREERVLILSSGKPYSTTTTNLGKLMVGARLGTKLMLSFILLWVSTEWNGSDFSSPSPSTVWGDGPVLVPGNNRTQMKASRAFPSRLPSSSRLSLASAETTTTKPDTRPEEGGPTPSRRRFEEKLVDEEKVSALIHSLSLLEGENRENKRLPTKPSASALPPNQTQPESRRRVGLAAGVEKEGWFGSRSREGGLVWQPESRRRVPDRRSSNTPPKRGLSSLFTAKRPSASSVSRRMPKKIHFLSPTFSLGKRKKGKNCPPPPPPNLPFLLPTTSPKTSPVIEDVAFTAIRRFMFGARSFYMALRLYLLPPNDTVEGEKMDDLSTARLNTTPKVSGYFWLLKKSQGLRRHFPVKPVRGRVPCSKRGERKISEPVIPWVISGGTDFSRQQWPGPPPRPPLRLSVCLFIVARSSTSSSAASVCLSVHSGPGCSPKVILVSCTDRVP